jgi:hypothetical protein
MIVRRSFVGCAVPGAPTAAMIYGLVGAMTFRAGQAVRERDQ